MGSIKNAFKFIFSPTASRTTGILVILIIAAAVPLTVFIAQKQQELRQRAVETTQVSVSTQTCMPPFNVFVGKYCSVDLAFQNAQNDPDNFNIKIVESSNAILPEDLTLCNNGKDPVYYVYEKGKQGNACTATDPASRSLFSGICSDRGNCDGTITVLPTPKPPIIDDSSTPTPAPTRQADTCTGNSGYQCSNSNPAPGTCIPAPYPAYQCGSTPGFCWQCSTSQASTPSTPTSPQSASVPTATTVPAASPAAQAPGSRNLCIYKSNVEDLRRKFSKGEGVSLRDINSLARSYNLADNTCRGQ